jgi:hypothetical protein
MGRRGCRRLPANASGLDPHRASTSGRVWTGGWRGVRVLHHGSGGVHPGTNDALMMRRARHLLATAPQ